MNKWLLGTSLALIACGAHAQTATSTNVYAKVVSSCAAQSYTAGQFQYVLMDATGDLCTNAAGGGGGAITGPLGTQTLAASVAVTDLSLQPGGAAYNAITGAIPAGTNVIGYTTADPCAQATKSTADFESTTSGGSIITATASNKAYICSIVLVTSVAEPVSIIEGTGSSVCTGGTPSGDFLNPGTTAANGAQFAANGGVTFGNGSATIAKNATVNQNTCVIFSGTPQVNVHVSYVVAP